MRCATLLALTALAGPAAAQDRAVPDSLRAEMEMATLMMGPMMQQMGAMLLEGTLEALARPENAERLATFIRNFYDALVRKGFSEEQALRIVIGIGMPTPMSPGQ